MRLFSFSLSKIANRPSITVAGRLRHELLNLLTVVTVLLEEEHPSKIEKKEVKNLLQIMGLFLAHETLFLGRKPQFFRQKTNVGELVTVLLDSFQDEIRSRKIRIDFPDRGKKFIVSCDRYYTSEALSKILWRFLMKASFLRCTFSTAGMLVLEHDISVENDFQMQPLSSLLNVKAHSYDDIAYQLGLHILRSQKKAPRISSQKIEIFL